MLGVFNGFRREWSVNDIARLVRAHERFNMLSEADAVTLVQHMHPIRLNAGEALFKEGRTDSHFMALILEGEAKAETDGGGLGERVMLGKLKEGDLVGEQGILQEHPRSATVTATTELMAAAIDASRFDKLVKSKPALGCTIVTSMLRTVTGRLFESNQRLYLLEQSHRKLEKELQMEISMRRNARANEPPPPPLELDDAFFQPPPDFKRP